MYHHDSRLVDVLVGSLALENGSIENRNIVQTPVEAYVTGGESELIDPEHASKHKPQLSRCLVFG